jgi:tight adherence protein B
MSPTLLSIIIGGAVIALVGFLGLVMTKGPSFSEQRLDGSALKRKLKAESPAGFLLRTPTINPGTGNGFAARLPRFEGLGRLYEQADVGLPFRQFLSLAAAMALLGGGIGKLLGLPFVMLPLGAAFLGLLPFLWLWRRKRKRIKAFVAQLPDALELVGRALRAGHGLASGLSMVAEEMPPPISQEFARVFEEQNLGIPLEEALRGLAERLPTIDVRFFVTAVVVQRGTGGDLAEVLDKIGRLIRERFQLLGQVQALTGEGRLSGIVLLAMPPALLAFCYTSNPEYIGLLFSTPLGVKMLAITAVLQVLGAVAIKKIITIKV